MEDIIKLRSGYKAVNYLKKGQELEEAKAVVKSIDFVEGYGWTITFE